MIRKTFVALCLLLLAGLSAANASQLAKGDVELQFRFMYNDLDFDGPGGDSDSTEVLGFFGYMLTDHHEVGAGMAYAEFGSSDALEYGVSYNYNFRSGTILNPYLGAFILGFGGDRGDVFDLGFAAEIGVKIYPWSHAGMVLATAYRELEGAGGVPDATNVLVFSGISLKF